MQSIRNVTIFLINITIIYTLWFYISLYLNILDETNEAIIINLMTGFATSALISYVEYRNELNKNITYFLSELMWFYRTLYRLKRGLNSSITLNKKIKAISEELKFINIHAKNKQELIDIELLIDSRKNKKIIKMLNDTYELTFGIEFIPIELNYKVLKKKTLMDKKQYVDNIKKMIEAEFIQIEINLKDLHKYELSDSWRALKKSFISKSEKL